MEVSPDTIALAVTLATFAFAFAVLAYVAPSLYAEAQAEGHAGEAGVWAFLGSLFRR